MPYFVLTTKIGLALEATAKATGVPIQLSHLAVGDGGGAAVTPSENQTELVREVWRGPLNTLSEDPLNPGWLIAEAVIPEGEGGWTIREFGLFDSAGRLYAVANAPESYKPELAEGSAKTFYIRMRLAVANTSTVTLLIDPSVVLATKEYVTIEVGKVRTDLDDHVADLANPHQVTAVQAGAEPVGAVGDHNADQDAHLALRVTPPQFDHDTSLATTEFVQRALGNVRGFLAINASIALTAAQAGLLFQVGNGTPAGQTITLPAISDLPHGACYWIYNASSSVPITVACAGADSFVSGGSSIVLNPMEFAIFDAQPNSLWNVLGTISAIQLKASLAANGYQKNPSGLIEQWGNATINANSTLVVTLPTTFLVALYGCLVTSVDSNTTTGYRVGYTGGTTSTVTLINTSPLAQVVSYRAWGK